jgi:hypothetical protein
MMILLRLLHILTGITWVGAMVFMTFFLIPVFRVSPPALAGQVMQGLAKRRYMQLMPLIALVTMLSGIWMIWITSGGNLGMYMQTRSGHSFATAGGLAILAFALGIVFGRPTGIKAAAIGARLATVTDPVEKAKLVDEMTVLQKKTGMISVGVTILLIIAAGGMAIARYV